MGGGASRPISTTFQDEPYPGLQQPRLDNLSRSMANDCNECKLELITGITTSTVKLTREFGGVSGIQCGSYAFAKQQVQQKQLSLQDFLAALQQGKYHRENGMNNGYCEQVEISPEDASQIKNIGEVDAKIKVSRIQPETSGGFSAPTKAVFTLSIPFKMKLSASGQSREVSIKYMTMYHPCPLRVEGVQYDAVLSLNDPFKSDSEFVILIPIVGSNKPSPSADFLGKIMSQIAAVTQPDPASGRYLEIDIPTGTGWSLRKLFNTNPSDPKEVEKAQSVEITDGFYQWVGVAGLKRQRVEVRARDVGWFLSGGRNPVVGYRNKWVPSGEPSPRYLMMDRPIICNPTDLATLTQRLPATPPEEAINPVLYSDSPFFRGIVHKQGATPYCDVREQFTNADMNGVTEESCDPWINWANRKNAGFNTSAIVNAIFNALVFIAAGLGAYIAFLAISKMVDVNYKDFAVNAGKLIGVYARDLRGKVENIKSGISTLSNPVVALQSAAETAVRSKLPIKIQTRS